jgi:hypothetical protein
LVFRFEEKETKGILIKKTTTTTTKNHHPERRQDCGEWVIPSLRTFFLQRRIRGNKYHNAPAEC